MKAIAFTHDTTSVLRRQPSSVSETPSLGTFGGRPGVLRRCREAHVSCAMAVDTEEKS
jgi:hypothetical protein